MDIWQSILKTIEKDIDPRTFENWFMPIRLLSMDQETIEIEVPNKFFKDWFCENYLPLMKKAVFAFTNKEYLFKLSCSKQKRGARPHNYNKSLAMKPSPSLNGLSIGDPLNQNYSFENFMVGNSNQFAHAASLAVATNPAKAYNPLFIYGGVGLGKTHLLNAIGNSIINKSIKICYVSSENFMNELINSIRYDRMTNFREKFRGIEILLIDDIQFIAGKERTQEEFFHTFNSLYESQKQIVLTSDKFPKEIPFLEERLRSRFEWGLIADIQPPETETKVAILKSKAYSNNIPLPDDVAFFLAENIKSNIRELEGSLIRIGAFASLTESEINLNLVKEVLKEIILNKSTDVSIDTIQKAVASFFKITVSALNSNKKLKTFSLPRHIAMYLSRKLTNFSFPEIGASFGGKDHSTVIYAVNKIDKQIESNSSIREAINSIRAKLE